MSHNRVQPRTPLPPGVSGEPPGPGGFRPIAGGWPDGPQNPQPGRQLSGLPPHPAPLRGPRGGWAPREGTPSLQLKGPTVCSVTCVSSPEGSAPGRWVPRVPLTTGREALLKVMQLPGQPGEGPVCLPSLPSKVPNLRLRHRSSWPTCALLWGGHLGPGGTVTPRWTRHHSDSPAPCPPPTGLQPAVPEEGVPESQAG